jgi:uncharacterized surface protein with fasciclin (FAS1) repeats
MLTMRFARITMAVAVAALIGGTPLPGRSQAPPKNIVDTAMDAGNFKTLTRALTEAGLVEMLKGPGPFTVFAPTDEAFAKLPPGELDAWMKNQAALKNVLTYHVVPGNVLIKDLPMFSEAKTAQGQTVRVTTVNPAGVIVETSKVIKADVPASNGVIHVIDTVMLPRPG